MAKIKNIESISNMLICSSVNSAVCDKHYQEYREKKVGIEECVSCFSSGNNFEECENHKVILQNDDCNDCMMFKNMATDFQTHNHTFTCEKKKKRITIKSDEGHGRNDGIIKGSKISDIALCRFNFPQFPLHKTTFIHGMSKSLSTEERNRRKSDLRKIKKFLIRISDDDNLNSRFQNWTFLTFLYEVGMFLKMRRNVEDYSSEEKSAALERYRNALSASVRGSGTVFLKRNTCDLYTNNFNRRLLGIHKANHDIQIVIDQVFKNLDLKCQFHYTIYFFQYACA